MNCSLPIAIGGLPLILRKPLLDDRATGPIGKRTGVANILGVNFSGFMAWWLWRTIYLMKLPRFEKKVLVALDWTLDLLFSKDLVQFRTTRPSTLSPMEELEKQASPALVGAGIEDAK